MSEKDDMVSKEKAGFKVEKIEKIDTSTAKKKSIYHKSVKKRPFRVFQIVLLITALLALSSFVLYYAIKRLQIKTVANQNFSPVLPAEVVSCKKTEVLDESAREKAKIVKFVLKADKNEQTDLPFDDKDNMVLNEYSSTNNSRLVDNKPDINDKSTENSIYAYRHTVQEQESHIQSKTVQPDNHHKVEEVAAKVDDAVQNPQSPQSTENSKSQNDPQFLQPPSIDLSQLTPVASPSGSPRSMPQTPRDLHDEESSEESSSEMPMLYPLKFIPDDYYSELSEESDKLESNEPESEEYVGFNESDESESESDDSESDSPESPDNPNTSDSPDTSDSDDEVTFEKDENSIQNDSESVSHNL